MKNCSKVLSAVFYLCMDCRKSKYRNERSVKSMRVHGRFLKDVAALMLLLAIASLLLPFCRFQAAGREMSLSGVEVLTRGAGAGYTYIQQGSVPDDFVVKDPFTWADLRGGISEIDQSGHMNLLVAAGVAAGLPVVLCLLSVCMLFLAEGKKTMVLPTVFTAVNVTELGVLLFGVPLLTPYLKQGVYLFALFHVIALVMIVLGWLLGGYRKPDRTQDHSSEKDRGDRDRDRSRSGRHKRGRRRKSRRKKKKKDKGRENSDGKQSSKQDDTSGQPATGAMGHIGEGSGIYSTITQSFSSTAVSQVRLGTTQEAMHSLMRGERDAACLAEHSCQIEYHPKKKSYTLTSHAAEEICLRQNGRLLKTLRQGERVRVLGQIEMKTTQGSLWLK